MAAKIIGFAGSTRKDSVNRVVAQAALQGAADVGADVTWVELRDYPLPLYDGDLEASDGIPANAMALKDILGTCDGYVIGCPEYNSSITPLLKNTIDWVSRPVEGRPRMEAFEGKVAGLVSGSGGPLGGLRGLVHVRAILGNLGVLVVPAQRALGGAPGKISDNTVSDDEGRSSLELVGRRVAEVANALTRS